MLICTIKTKLADSKMIFYASATERNVNTWVKSVGKKSESDLLRPQVGLHLQGPAKSGVGVQKADADVFHNVCTRGATSSCLYNG